MSIKKIIDEAYKGNPNAIRDFLGTGRDIKESQRRVAIREDEIKKAMAHMAKFHEAYAKYKTTDEYKSLIKHITAGSHGDNIFWRVFFAGFDANK